MCPIAGGTTFDTCEHGKFLQEIADCWLAGRGGPNCPTTVCQVPEAGAPLATCEQGFDLTFACVCSGNKVPFRAADCVEAEAKAKTACGPTVDAGSGPTSCDPFGTDCPAGTACYRSGCAPPGTYVLGEPCVNHSDCIAGANCLISIGSSGEQDFCAKNCALSSSAPSAVRCDTLCPDTYAQMDDTLGLCPDVR